jgi:hypothetical protein
MGPIIYRMLEKEQRHLANGWTYEPATIYEKNAGALGEKFTSGADLKGRLPEIQWATCEPSPAASAK